MSRTYATGFRHKTRATRNSRPIRRRWHGRSVPRIRLPDRKLETLVSLKDFRVVDDPENSPSLYAAPDDSILVTRDVGSQEVYAITVKWP